MYFSRSNELTLIDMIPLHEVTSVAATQDNEHSERSIDHSSHPSEIRTMEPSMHNRSQLQDSTAQNRDDSSFRGLRGSDYLEDQFNTLIQIKTIHDGFNSGRVYFLQTKSEELRRTVVRDILNAVENSKVEKASKSHFRSAQAKVERIYSTMQFQIAVAILIIAVRKQNTRSLSPRSPQLFTSTRGLANVCNIPTELEPKPSSKLSERV
jgi:hypothetical protein